MNFRLYAMALTLLPILMLLSACATSTKSLALPSGFCDQDEPLTPYYRDIGPPEFKSRTERMYAKHMRLCGG